MIKNKLGTTPKVKELLGWSNYLMYQTIKEFVEQKIITCNNDVEAIGEQMIDFIDIYCEGVDKDKLDEYYSCCGNCSGNPNLDEPHFECAYKNCKPWMVCTNWEKGITIDAC